MIPQGHQTRDATHERKDVDVIGLLFVAALILTVITLSFLAASGVVHFMRSERHQQRPAPLASPNAKTFPEPRLETTPGMALSKDAASQRVELESYGWINREKGVLRIPIKRAMALLVQRGLPEVGAGQTRLQLMQGRPRTDQQPKHPIATPTPSATP